MSQQRLVMVEIIRVAERPAVPRAMEVFSQRTFGSSLRHGHSCLRRTGVMERADEQEICHHRDEEPDEQPHRNDRLLLELTPKVQ